jgi:3-oxoacyl-[acyl-carrier-protein] synthase-3
MAYSRFESLGAYLPEKSVSTQDLVSRMQFKPPFDLEAITGIHQRRVCGESEDSFSLALSAARDCLKRSRYRAEDLDIVISTSISRFRGREKIYWDPSFALQIARELGAKSAIHFDISNACAGMMSGVYVLDRMIKAGMVKTGMVVSGESIFKISDTAVHEIRDPSDPQFASLTVGDSGAAVIMDVSLYQEDRIHFIELTTCAEYSHLCIGKPSEQGNGPALYTNNKEMHKEDRVKIWPNFQADFLQKRGTDFAAEGYDYIVQHQVGQRAIENFCKYGAKVFNAEMPESLSCVSDLANTATTSHFVVLYQHLKENRVRKGAKILLVPAASGLVTGFLSATISSLDVNASGVRDSELKSLGEGES